MFMNNNFQIRFKHGICFPIALLICCTSTTQATAFQSASKPAPTEQALPETAESTSDQTEADEATPKSVKERLDKLTADYEVALAEWEEKFEATKTRAAAARLARIRPQLAYSDDILAIYEANPNDKDAQAALAIALEMRNPKNRKRVTEALLEVARDQAPEQAQKSFVAVVRFAPPESKKEAVDKLFEFVEAETDNAVAIEMLKPIANPRMDWRREEAANKIWDLVKAKPEEADFDSLALVALEASIEASTQAYAALLEHHRDHEDFGSVLNRVPKKPHDGFAGTVRQAFKDGKGTLKTQAAISLAKYIENSHFFLDLEKMSDEQIAILGKEKQDLKEYLATVVGDSRLDEEAKRELFLLENLSPGLEAPDIVGADLDGKELKLSDYRGKVVLVSFWGDWCPPCRAMLPHERSLTKILADKPFTIVGINSDRKPNITETVCEPKNLTWPCFTDFQDDKRISDDWEVRGWPTTYLIDKDGIIRYKGLRGEELDIALEKLLAEMDIEVNLKEIDHESEDEKAMEAHREARKEAGFDDPTE